MISDSDFLLGMETLCTSFDHQFRNKKTMERYKEELHVKNIATIDFFDAVKTLSYGEKFPKSLHEFMTACWQAKKNRALNSRGVALKEKGCSKCNYGWVTFWPAKKEGFPHNTTTGACLLCQSGESDICKSILRVDPDKVELACKHGGDDTPYPKDQVQAILRGLMKDAFGYVKPDSKKESERSQALVLDKQREFAGYDEIPF